MAAITNEYFKYLSRYLLVFIFISAGNLYAQEEYDNRITLRIGQLSGNISSVHPFIFNTLEEKELSDMVYGKGIVLLDDLGEFTPGIISEYYPKETHWLLTVAKNVFFHDGTQLTAKDIAFSIKTYKKLKYNNKVWYNYSFDYIKDVEVADVYSVKIHITQPVENFLYILSRLPAIPAHLLEGKPDNEIMDFLYNRRPTGTGPFQITSKTDSFIDLAIFPDYYGKKSKIERITINFYNSEEQLKKAFVTGNVDLISLKDYKGAKDVSGQSRNIRVFMPPLDMKPLYYIVYNLSNSLFSNANVRKALSHAIHKNEILTKISRSAGFRHLATGPIFNGSWAYYPDVEKYQYQPKKSIRYLSSSGWRDSNKDGLLDKRNKTFSFELLFPRGYSFYEEIARLIVINFSEIGIHVSPIPTEPVELYRRIQSRDFQAAIHNSFFDDNDICGSLRNFFLYNEEKKSENILTYKNLEVFRNIERAQQIKDKKRLRPIYERIQALMADDIPCTFLFFEGNTYKAFYTNIFRNYIVDGKFLPYEYWEKPDFVQR